jgi:hypothetical protein
MSRKPISLLGEARLSGQALAKRPGRELCFTILQTFAAAQSSVGGNFSS